MSTENRLNQETPDPWLDPPWPEKLKAKIVEPGMPHKILGYDVMDDLSVHYSFAENLLLTLTGEPPDECSGKAFETALIALSPTSCADAATHAAGIGRLCGADITAVQGIASLGLSEMAQECVKDHQELLSWLAAPETPFPSKFECSDESERKSVTRLWKRLSEIGFSSPAAEVTLGLIPTLVAVLYGCGLTKNEQLVVAIVVARFTCAMAEALSVIPCDFSSYPANLPPFEYVEEK